MKKIAVMVEPACPGDIPAIGGLYEELYACMADLQPDNFRLDQQNEEFLQKTIADSDSDILVAREQGRRVSGFAVVQCRNTPDYPGFLPRRYTRLLDIVVEENCRELGIGRALLEGAERWARERGPEFIELGVLSENRPAIGAYESFGFRERRKVMELDLKR